jgi:hypothetical protein
MTEERRAEIAEAIAALADQVERKHNPLVEDLDDDARLDVEGLLREELPAMTAAAALVPGRWAAADGSIAVRATSVCSPGARCFPLKTDRAPSDRVEAQARFLAWPLAHAIVVRADPQASPRVLTALRCSAARSRIALALGDDDRKGLRPSEALGKLAASAMRLADTESDDPWMRVLRRLRRAGVDDGDLSWLALPAGTVLVVPRLAALASLPAFRDEVHERVASAAATVEWVYEPPL